MFSKTKPTVKTTTQTDVPVKSVPSILSADLVITGNISSSGEIQVDGKVDGDIRCKALIVGIDGAVTGEVVAQNVRLHGEIVGRVRAKSVFLASTAKMIGDIAHESLAIEPGAFLEGHCRRVADEEAGMTNTPQQSGNGTASKPAQGTAQSVGSSSTTKPAAAFKPAAVATP